ncbi:DNA-directed RNA polymerase subunit B-like protein [Leptotrombidium deliense]|uniref:DNA-directed RNA polymerase n=1 Tax=Leptotrombidium deliense TaxID=299467 RepID=A0A443SKQ8_9ACAR|nr:DNA-directed RNA polymerase subunit B-like protein [Leptotrombidium deliense]
MQPFATHASLLPRLDLLITELLSETVFPLDFYYNRPKKVGIFRSSPSSLLSPKHLYTSTVTEWLLDQYSADWHESLSPSVNGTTPIMGTVAHHGFLFNHTSTNKITAGLCGHRHAVGFPVRNILKHSERSLCYPQNDLARRDSMPIPTQLAFTALICDAGDNVEDGLTMRSDLADLQFGENTISFSATITATPCGSKISISFPKKTRMTQNAECDYVNEITIAKWKLGSKNAKKRKVDSSFRTTVVTVPKLLQSMNLKHETTLCDIIGVTNLKSYSTNLKSIMCQSASRILFVDPYDSDLLNNNVRSIRLKSIHTNLNVQSGDVNITFSFFESRKLIHGDKFSTLEGQKATVINLTRKEDMPFVMDPAIPTIDVLMNVSATKRHTYGMFVSSLLRAAKCAKPEKFDLTLLMGDTSIGHHTNDIVARMLKDAEFLTKKQLFDGRTGEPMGYADIFLCAFIKYNQEPVKVIYFAPDGDYVARTHHADQNTKGRGRIGGTRRVQTDLHVCMLQGNLLVFERQCQICSESRLVIDIFTSIVSQSAASCFKTLGLHGIKVAPG